MVSSSAPLSLPWKDDHNRVCEQRTFTSKTTIYPPDLFSPIKSSHSCVIHLHQKCSHTSWENNKFMSWEKQRVLVDLGLGGWVYAKSHLRAWRLDSCFPRMKCCHQEFPGSQNGRECKDCSTQKIVFPKKNITPQLRQTHTGGIPTLSNTDICGIPCSEDTKFQT